MIEYIGRFRLYPLDTREGGWSLSYDEVWLPILAADRDACMIIVGLVLAGMSGADLEKIQLGLNAVRAGQCVTTEMLLTAMGEGAA